MTTSGITSIKEENRHYSRHGHGPDSIDDIPFSCPSKNIAVNKILIKLHLLSHLQGGAGYFVFPEKGKRAKIFFGKGRFQFQNRAIKTKNIRVFSMKEYFGSQKIKED